MRAELHEAARNLAVGEARGFRGIDGRFDFERNGARWLMFKERDDIVYFRPENGEIARLEGRAFGLGTAWIDDPWTYAIEDSLKLVSSVERWLECGGKALFVIDWNRAFSELQRCSRIEIDESIRSTYNRAMRPPRLPAVRTAFGR
jgi:hypothetical protein